MFFCFLNIRVAHLHLCETNFHVSETNFRGYLLLQIEKKSYFVGTYFGKSPDLQIIAGINFHKYLKNVKYFCKLLLGLG